MKKLIFILVTLVFICSCTSKEGKAKKLVTDYVTKNLPKSWEYEPLEFSQLDSAFTEFYDTPEYKTKNKEVRYADSVFIYDSIMHALYYGEVGYQDSYYKKQRDDKQKQLNELEKKYRKSYIGYGITHLYKCKTDFGDSIFSIYCIIDAKQNKIIKDYKSSADSKRYDDLKKKDPNFKVFPSNKNWNKVFYDPETLLMLDSISKSIK